MSTPSWQLSPRPYWELASFRAEHRPPIKRTATIYRTAFFSPEIERATGGEGAMLNMRFALFDRWQEIDNIEGHFMERIKPGAFRKSIRENLANIRAILSHGKDPSLGSTVLGKIEAIDETPDAATATVALFPSVPPLLVDGLEAGVYGASFRGEPIKNRVERRPRRSEHNPDGIPEITRLEIKLKDVGPTPFAQYEGTSARIQGVTAGVPRARRRDPQLVRETAPYWELGKQLEPAWQLRRKEQHGHTYCKA